MKPPPSGNHSTREKAFPSRHLRSIRVEKKRQNPDLLFLHRFEFVWIEAGGFDSSNGLVFMSNGGGNISIYHEDAADKFNLLQTVTTNPGSKTMALDTKSHNLFVPANLAGQFTVLVFGR